MTTRWRCSPRVNSSPAACPSRNAIPAVIGSVFALPLMPSVPNSRLALVIRYPPLRWARLIQPLALGKRNRALFQTVSARHKTLELSPEYHVREGLTHLA